MHVKICNFSVVGDILYFIFAVVFCIFVCAQEALCNEIPSARFNEMCATNGALKRA